MFLAPRAQLEIRVLQAPRVPLEHRVVRASKAYREYKEFKAFRVQAARQDQRVPQELTEPPAQLDLVVQAEHLAQPVLLDRKVLKESKG